MSQTENLYEAAAAFGLQTDFIDGHGRPHRTGEAALRLILDALPAPGKRSLLREVPVIRIGDRSVAVLDDASRGPIEWRIAASKVEIASGVAGNGQIVWPEHLPVGVYALSLRDADGATEQLPIIVAPSRAHGGGLRRCWLVAAQLYGVRSHRNWGIGDFTDLLALIDFAADHGADGIGLNPLHALFDDRPGDCSPYSPNSRQFLNWLYIDVEHLAGVVVSAEDRDEIVRLRASQTVDYGAVAALKRRALQAAFAHHQISASDFDRADFDAFRSEQGNTLARFAAFEVQRHRHTTPWWMWDALWAAPDTDAIVFVEYIQWVADRQLGACSARAAERGMTVGLYLDIAVGVQSDGFDAWDEQTAISRSLGVGAPPDPLNNAGQSWGLAGYNAAGLEARLFEPYRAMLRASMRHAGAIRLDHVLGLQRLYLIPHGFPPNEGVYVQMPLRALLAVTALESIAQGCIVIGEDLGTVPDGFRDVIAEWGVWSYRVMMFEQDFHSRAFFAPDAYPADALVTFNTHDLATYAGWRSLGDLATKRAIGLDPGESDDARRHAFAMLDDALRTAGIAGDGFFAVTCFLSRTPSRILAVALEDLLGVVAQPNIPGTVDEHPNWRQKLPVAIEDFPAAIDRDALRAATQERARASSASLG